TTTADIGTRELAKALEIRLLPKRPISEAEKIVKGQDISESASDESEDENAEEQEESDYWSDTDESRLKDKECWQSAGAVSDEVLDRAGVVNYVALPSEKGRTASTLFGF